MTEIEEEITNQMLTVIELHTNKDWGALLHALKDFTGSVQLMVESQTND